MHQKYNRYLLYKKLFIINKLKPKDRTIIIQQCINNTLNELIAMSNNVNDCPQYFYFRHKFISFGKNHN